MATRWYRFKLHICASGHYHVITAPEDVSWPFWSRDAGLKTLEIARLISREDSAAKKQFVALELRRLENEIEALARVRNRERGKFAPGYRMPREFLYRENDIAHFWQHFITGKSQCACYLDTFAGTDFLFPLTCDFVERPEMKIPEKLTRTAWIRLAEAPVKRKSMKDLGLKLEIA